MTSVENTGVGTLNLRFKVCLKPGKNEVDSDAWEQCKNDEMTRFFLAGGRIKVHGSVASEESAPPAEPEPIPESEETTDPGLVPSDMNATDAKAFIKACGSPATLELMLESETRRSVKSALDKRLTELNE